ncbi:GNAT family N-acetyltransferase [Agromyces atrinae]|uniref:GNAT family N-acetyltransferase n=1 Tax=Agromyces atrinae TaxID=592376 RepID=UPI001F59DCE0|nr:GNAT family N-acetyltransferase [Agromyces atrinae]MCI2958943.1 GNAT family N-acetyltransferase [Agromyces atrinae]
MEKPDVVTLRATTPADLDDLFRFGQDPESIRLAAFTAADPGDRDAFDVHWARLLADARVDARTIRADGALVGSIARWFEDGEPEITYWIDRQHWGRGIATRAARLFIASVPERPLRARVAVDNERSIHVLERLGFRAGSTSRDFAAGRGAETEERLYRLE